jgi:c-di-GMP-binding flagellar brake protein YcgR
MLKDPHEKRRTPRVPLAGKVKVETIRGTFNGSLRDLSEGGIGVFLAKMPPVGSVVELRFELPRDGAIAAMGEVTYHSREKGNEWFGVKFSRMDTRSHELIKSYVLANFDPAKASQPPPLAKG